MSRRPLDERARKKNTADETERCEIVWLLTVEDGWRLEETTKSRQARRANNKINGVPRERKAEHEEA